MSDVSRRHALRAITVGGLSIVATRPANATPEEIDDVAPLGFPENFPVPTIDELLTAAWKQTGVKPPYEEEVKFARTLLNEAPILS